MTAIRPSVRLALACAAFALVSPAAMAEKKPKPPAERTYDLTKAVRAAVGESQAAVKAGDLAKANAKLVEADAAAVTPDDKYVIASSRFEMARTQKDQAAQAVALEAMLDSGQVSPENLMNFRVAAGQLAYNNKDWAKAEQRLGEAVAAGSQDSDVYILLMESRVSQKKNVEAVDAFEKIVAIQQAANKPIPDEWYARGISVAYSANLAAPTERLTRARVAAYPTPTHWRDALIGYRDLNKLDTQYQLDLLRLLRANKGLEGGRDYLDYLEVTYQKFPGEAKAVLDEGVANGAIVLASNITAREFADVIKTRYPGDRASLAKEAVTAKGPGGTAVLALALADAYAGYGDYAPAIELYKLALTKPGADANLVNSRLGAALAQSGQADEARTVLNSVTGPRTALAKFWLVYVDQHK